MKKNLGFLDRVIPGTPLEKVTAGVCLSLIPILAPNLNNSGELNMDVLDTIGAISFHVLFVTDVNNREFHTHQKSISRAIGSAGGIVFGILGPLVMITLQATSNKYNMKNLLKTLHI